MKSKELLFWIWLAENLGAAPRDFKHLYSLNDSPYEFFRMEESEIEPLVGISSKTKQALANKDLRRASDILARCEREGYGVVTYGDEAYPALLREIDRPPVLLYYAGTYPNFATHLTLGIVGTRRMSAYGLRTAYKISYELSSIGALIVSGMAAGIDGVAACAALDAGQATVAVLGCGLDQVYPRHHGPLMQAIREGGVLLSEYSPGTKPNFYNFPIRNRIISGISHGTVVVEAGVGSGSLITANEAVRQGRDVFALPANVGAIGAEGTNGLLRDGARMVLEARDIVAPYQFLFSETLRPEEISRVEERSKPDLARLAALGVIELGTGEEAPKKEPAKLASGSPMKKAGAGKRRSESETPPPMPTASVPTPDATLASLSSVQRAVLDAIPDDATVTADALCNLGYPYGESIAALTTLEILGLVVKLPGALYKKA